MDTVKRGTVWSDFTPGNRKLLNDFSAFILCFCFVHLSGVCRAEGMLEYTFKEFARLFHRAKCSCLCSDSLSRQCT